MAFVSANVPALQPVPNEHLLKYEEEGLEDEELMDPESVEAIVQGKIRATKVLGDIERLLAPKVAQGNVVPAESSVMQETSERAVDVTMEPSAQPGSSTTTPTMDVSDQHYPHSRKTSEKPQCPKCQKIFTRKG